MKDILQIGLIGIGPWGKNYIKTINSFDDIQLRWICSPHRKIEELPAGCQFTNDYNTLLSDNQISGIIIATPPSTHHELAREALSANKDVLVEKPMTLSSENALELVVLSEKSSQILMVGHIYIYHSATHMIKKMIECGELGELSCFYSDRSDQGPGRTDINVMWDYAPHEISLMNYLSGENPVQVYAKKANSSNNKIENAVELTVTYPNGVKGHIYNSWTGNKKTRKMIIEGSEKTIIFDDVQKELKIFSNKKLDMYAHSFLNDRSPLELECSHFFECMRKREKPLTDAYEGYIITNTLKAAQKSLESEKEIPIDHIARKS